MFYTFTETLFGMLLVVALGVMLIFVVVKHDTEAQRQKEQSYYQRHAPMELVLRLQGKPDYINDTSVWGVRHTQMIYRQGDKNATMLFLDGLLQSVEGDMTLLDKYKPEYYRYGEQGRSNTMPEVKLTSAQFYKEACILRKEWGLKTFWADPAKVDLAFKAITVCYFNTHASTPEEEQRLVVSFQAILYEFQRRAELMNVQLVQG